MDIKLVPGRYVVAVSGGVDSMALLNMLLKKPKLDLVVAHFDHGIREESVADRKLVQEVARDRGLIFVYQEGKLGPFASEATARTARYEFLQKIKKDYQAKSIITAHHQDDLIETALINLTRGTGRLGLSSLTSTHEMKRPLLHVSKTDIKKYAKAEELVWNEDSTNKDNKHLRNKLRLGVVRSMSTANRKQILRLIMSATSLNQEINELITDYLQFMDTQGELSRYRFITLPHAVAKEVLAQWLRNQSVRTLDRKALDKLVVAVKTLPGGKQVDVDVSHFLYVGRTSFKLVKRQRFENRNQNK